MDQFHSLLKRQLKKYVGEEFNINEKWQNFLLSVNNAYQQSDADRNMLERSLDLSSQELLQNNFEMRAIFQSMPDIIFRINSEGVILSFESSENESFLLPSKYLIGKKIQNIPVKSISKQFNNAINLVNEKRITTIFEYQLTIKENECFYEVRMVPLLENQIIAIVRDISKRIQAEIEILKEKEKAESANKLKDEFIANISHEIRTPLNGVLGMTQLIRDYFFENINENNNMLFEGVTSSSQRLIRTVDLILNYSRISTGEYPKRPEKINISKICEQLIISYSSAAKLKSIELSFENRATDVIIYADEYSVTQAISNLIDNAIKYTEKGSVELILYKGINDELKLDVKDTGIGIKEERLGLVFEPYMQEEMGYGRAYEGVGLGLSLVKKFLEINNATISIKSKKGAGTIFTINFDKYVEPDEVKSLTPKIVDYQANILFPNQFAESNSIKVGKISANIKIKRVLLIEDDNISREVIKLFLNQNIEIIIADSSDGTNEILKNNIIDLILMDISIKGSMNGLTLTRNLKSSKEYSHIPIIVITAHAFEKDKENSYKAGCDEFISKPFTKEELLNKIGKFI
ncbi:MAG: hybrid sensor histidine kinase/response regulator [Ignavibacteriaceae bacterium]